MLEVLTKPENLAALATLTLLEVVLGIDNIVFIAIVSERVEAARRNLVRRIGLGLAVITRIILLFFVSFIVTLKKPLFTVFGVDFSGKSLVLLAGGIFLIVKATLEIYRKTELVDEHGLSSIISSEGSFWLVVGQIVLLDMIFSIESIITAVGMVGEILIMAMAVLIAVTVMMVFVDSISNYISKHVSLKLLALSFLMLIGVLLVAEGTGFSFPRGYVYFSMAFALFVQLLNIRYESKRARVKAA
jgi:predicted tellurium resistance membrane protein TerC